MRAPDENMEADDLLTALATASLIKAVPQTVKEYRTIWQWRKFRKAKDRQAPNSTSERTINSPGRDQDCSTSPLHGARSQRALKEEYGG